MFSQLGEKLQEIFKDLRGHGKISEANIDAAFDATSGGFGYNALASSSDEMASWEQL